MAGRYILPAAEVLRPLQQGKLSSMCGLYSVLNGIRLALYPQQLTRPQLQQAYRFAVKHLSSRRQLTRVLGVGMDYGVWAELRDELIAYVNAHHHAKLRAAPTLTGTAGLAPKRAIATIGASVRAGSPVLVALGGALNHYTVISGISDQRLMLFDSSNFHWLQKANVGVGEASRRRHWILTDQVWTIVDDW